MSLFDISAKNNSDFRVHANTIPKYGLSWGWIGKLLAYDGLSKNIRAFKYLMKYETEIPVLSHWHLKFATISWR